MYFLPLIEEFVSKIILGLLHKNSITVNDQDLGTIHRVT